MVVGAAIPLHAAVTELPRAIVVGVTANVGPPGAVTVNVLLVARSEYCPFAKSRSSYVPAAIVEGMTKAHDPDAAALPGVFVQLT